MQTLSQEKKGSNVTIFSICVQCESLERMQNNLIKEFKGPSSLNIVKQKEKVDCILIMHACIPAIITCGENTLAFQPKLIIAFHDTCHLYILCTLNYQNWNTSSPSNYQAFNVQITKSTWKWKYQIPIIIYIIIMFCDRRPQFSMI